ncbi:hypothetical protein GJU40_20195 [Bacillus lacus]|uniref:DUF5362 domain-containing protein n=1 Tax=Metabacillus lacus TaxID=1983721 RepID=A0A7X2M0B7_9BACI|nr:DUF5362 family protein [Metabacillus lacus]MRX74436.1 hypothetical protein [Metabacillus lacus]
MQMQESLRNISKWGAFLGYLFIILGGLYALVGLFLFIVGAIPGIISIFLGIYILRSARQAKDLLQEYEEKALAELMLNYAKFLRLLGILMAIGLIINLIAIGFWMFILITGFNTYY